jgi:hypothetical protein
VEGRLGVRRPLDCNEGAWGRTLLTMDIPGDVFAAYEWVEDEKTSRESLIPADVLNPYGRPSVVNESDLGVTNRVPFGDIEIDKIPGAWVVTYWLPDDITLRLKVRHSCVQDPDDCVAEVRLRADEDFQPIHEFSTCTYALTHLNECPEVWDEVPPGWAHAFMTMAQVWARLTMIA